MGLTIIPVAAVIATKDRAATLARTLDSLAAQGVLPAEVVAVDGSVGDDSRRVLENWGAKFASQIAVRWQRAEKLGAAKVNIEYCYCATSPGSRRGLLILRVKNPQKALKVLNG